MLRKRNNILWPDLLGSDCPDVAAALGILGSNVF